MGLESIITHFGMLVTHFNEIGKKNAFAICKSVLVPMVGLEPARSCLQQILSLPRLPFRHIGLRLL